MKAQWVGDFTGRTSAYLLALALAAGTVDASNYLGLGRVFTANMTGNTVLLGVALARGSTGDAARSVAALTGFCAGAAFGVALAREHGPWPQIATRSFLLEVFALAVLMVVWAAVGVGTERLVLIAVSGIAMGAQSAAVRASNVRGVNTTYMTGTLLNAVAQLVQRARRLPRDRERPGLPGAAWATYALGALGGAFAVKAWHAAVVAIPLAIVAAVTAAAGCENNR